MICRKSISISSLILIVVLLDIIIMPHDGNADPRVSKNKFILNFKNFTLLGPSSGKKKSLFRHISPMSK